jgi:hypothetical protein
MYRWTRRALLGAVAIVLGSSAALAATSLKPSSLALSRVDLGRAAAATDIPVSPVLLAAAPAPEPVQFGAVRYQPEQQQQQYDNPASDRPIVSQLHGGYFDASANNTNPFIVGLRAGPMIDKRLQVGLMLDWVHQTKNLANVLSTTEGPGSITVKTQQDTARALLNLVPIMAFAQASGFGLLGLVPYSRRRRRLRGAGALGGQLRQRQFVRGQLRWLGLPGLCRLRAPARRPHAAERRAVREPGHAVEDDHGRERRHRQAGRGPERHRLPLGPRLGLPAAQLELTRAA